MPVQLGFIADFDGSLSKIPQNQIGGKPEGLASPVPMQNCSRCGEDMKFLLQIYCPEDYPVNAFHRMLYVFCCPKNKCENFSLLRSQLPMDNEYYNLDGDLIKPRSDQVCVVCGCFSKFRCTGCNSRRFCSKQHQIYDWKIHEDDCRNGLNSVIKDWNSSLFPVYSMDEDPEQEKTVGVVPAALQEQLNTIEVGDDVLAEEDETETEVDQAFLKFQKRITRDPTQVLRYGRVLPEGNEEPLWVSNEGRPTAVPDCPHCQSPRTFEFQVSLPVLILDHASTTISS